MGPGGFPGGLVPWRLLWAGAGRWCTGGTRACPCWRTAAACRRGPRGWCRRCPGLPTRPAAGSAEAAGAAGPPPIRWSLTPSTRHLTWTPPGFSRVA